MGLNSAFDEILVVNLIGSSLGESSIQFNYKIASSPIAIKLFYLLIETVMASRLAIFKNVASWKMPIDDWNMIIR